MRGAPLGAPSRKLILPSAPLLGFLEGEVVQVVAPFFGTTSCGIGITNKEES